MRRLVLILLASLFTAGFWWVVFFAVYAPALLAGDRDPAAPPRADDAVIAGNVAIMVGAVLLYAALSLAWQRLVGRGTTKDRR